MTFAEIRDLIWAGLGSTATAATDKVTAATLNKMLDAWEIEIIKQIITTLPRSRWSDYLDNLISTNTVTGNGTTKAWTLPATFFDGGDCRVTNSGVVCNKVDPNYQRLADVNTMFAGLNSDRIYYVFYDKLNFITAPSNGNSLVLYYIRNPRGTLDSESALPKKLHQLAVWYCLRECYTIDGDDYQAAEYNKKYLEESRALIK